MAEDRTEAPTPKRRGEARKQGQTARSQDLTGATVLLVGLYALKSLVGALQGRISDLLVGNILAIGALDRNAPPSLGTSVLGLLLGTLPVLLGVMAFAAAAVSVLQGGFIFVPGLLTPKFERVNPVSGMTKIASIQGLIALGKALVKFAVIALIATTAIRARAADLAAIGALDLGPALRLLANLVWEILFKSAIAMLALGIADWLWERRRFLQSIRMTKQEVEEEAKQSEGDPQVRAQIKGKRQQFLKQMMKDVRTADVVVTNPTHFAVALRYDPAAMAAPTVIAKGQDYLAVRIREAAREAGVPVMENPPLARALHKLVPVGREIPPGLYVAVAEALAFIFRLKRERMAA